MKLGISSYSLSKAIQAGEMTIVDVVQWVADNGGEHLEICPIGFTLDDNPHLLEAIRRKVQETGIDISNYTIAANFIQPGEAGVAAEVARVKRQVDIAAALGVKRMRHDVATRPIGEATITNFIADLPIVASACRQVADYAAPLGITTSVENHGYYVQASDRVQALVQAVDRPNYRTTLDVGNFLSVDEDPVAAVKRNTAIASMVHVKDFYVRPADRNPGDGWMTTASGNYLRGAVVGHGDIDMREVLRAIKRAGYDGYISVEFEGLESCTYGTRTGLDNVRRIWQEV
ncbi:sugar phosphate isomerase/epimerase family protein [Paenibacillus cymbidii]|uniref:sugar phosphate isomerase/epimerase family protein n=1 Tax=Paenibacillus cymbidii TaxID=1639034 RepID=UPI001080E31F|nr:sugar phosphate isomerase/epimerase [Paenibacillus cymbidii]